MAHEDVARIVAMLEAQGDRLGRMEDKLDQVDTTTRDLVPRMATLERQDEVTRGNVDRFWSQQWPALEGRVQVVEAAQGALIKVAALETTVDELQASLSMLRDGLAAKATVVVVDAEATRITALETDRARRDGMSKALIIGWTVVTAAPGLIGLILTVWKLSS